MAITQQLQRSARPFGTRSAAASQSPTGRPATLWGRGERPFRGIQCRLFGEGSTPAAVCSKRGNGGALAETSTENECLLAGTARLRHGSLVCAVERREKGLTALMTLIHGDWRQEVAPVIGEFILMKRGKREVNGRTQHMGLWGAHDRWWQRSTPVKEQYQDQYTCRNGF